MHEAGLIRTAIARRDERRVLLYWRREEQTTRLVVRGFWAFMALCCIAVPAFALQVTAAAVFLLCLHWMRKPALELLRPEVRFVLTEAGILREPEGDFVAWSALAGIELYPAYQPRYIRLWDDESDAPLVVISLWEVGGGQRRAVAAIRRMSGAGGHQLALPEPRQT